ncbi:unnamed protein product [Arabis nemorensis]|uniref:60S ribosomal protein L41 n=1 Tax=Arabis nemorensis TaxID=586526 RepID=A0A565B699_9BRAS|nr:unnamed protein product [Arabis nemorensis]
MRAKWKKKRMRRLKRKRRKMRQRSNLDRFCCVTEPDLTTEQIDSARHFLPKVRSGSNATLAYTDYNHVTNPKYQTDHAQQACFT